MGSCEGRFDLLLYLVETLASSRLVGLVDLAQALLHAAELARLGTEKLDPRGFQRVCRIGSVEGRLGLFGERIQARKEIVEGHDSCFSVPGKRARGSGALADYLSRECFASLFDHRVERGWVVDGHLGQHLTVEFDVGLF